jgi:hypothetical protein
MEGLDCRLPVQIVSWLVINAQKKELAYTARNLMGIPEAKA